MSIVDFLNKIKSYFWVLFILFISLILTGLVYINLIEVEKTPVSIVMTSINDNQGSEVIVSKNGTKYYYPWCGALSRIKPENRVIFASASLARQAGYKPAQNCKGVK